MPLPTLNIAASQDTTHPQHNFHLAQILATVFLGLTTYAAVQKGGAKQTLTDPATLAQVAEGFTNIWVTQPPTQQTLGLVTTNQTAPVELPPVMTSTV